ncbi:MAG: DUF5916 domain-containing protein, partial [Saprospiraceae bacterium]
QIADVDKKRVPATRIAETIELDGQLNEAIWQTAPIATDFIENQPNPGNPAQFKTDVKVAYDNGALYIAARMYDVAADSVMRELSQRDNLGNTDWFGIFMNPYRDGINGVGFIITPAGVQFDAQYTTFGEDEDWDAVWEAETQILEDGWVTEIKIPYSAIRFPKENEQTWGINFGRMVRRVGQKYFWSHVDPQQQGFLNQAGLLTNISDIKSPVRLAATPFVAGYVENYYDKESEVPSSWGRSFNAGMDIRYGINDAFTLDMTLIPDFGEARSDNQVLNLSPFEVRFNENRQFFKEGTELFNKGGLFYSRRIGGTPLNYYDVEDQLGEGETIVENPQNVQLYNATKVSGRTTKGLGVGVFNATAGRMAAIIDNPELGQREFETNPLTNYSVFVLDQNLKNNSYATLINTTVLRNGGTYDANVTGGILSLNNKANSYRLYAQGALSQKYSPENTELGHMFRGSLSKTSGNFQTFIGYNEESDTYDPNDLGFLRANNERSINGNFRYNYYEPFAIFNNAGAGVYYEYNRLYNPDVFTGVGVNAWAYVQTKKFWNFETWTYFEPVTGYDYFEPRTEGRYYRMPKNRNFGTWFGSDRRKKFAFSAFTNYRTFDEEGRKRWNWEISPRYRFNDKFNVEFEIGNYRDFNDIGYVNTEENGDIIFGRRDVNTVINSIEANYNFSSKMALVLRGRHYWSKVEYNQFNLLEQDGTLGETAYFNLEDNDQSFNAFTIDMIYRWRFAPGSDIFLVWKNSVFGGDNLVNINYFENTRKLFNNPQSNSLSLKVIYYLDYLDVVKNKG